MPRTPIHRRRICILDDITVIHAQANEAESPQWYELRSNNGKRLSFDISGESKDRFNSSELELLIKRLSR